jgi:hypothetical protein
MFLVLFCRLWLMVGLLRLPVVQLGEDLKLVEAISVEGVEHSEDLERMGSASEGEEGVLGVAASVKAWGLELVYLMASGGEESGFPRDRLVEVEGMVADLGEAEVIGIEDCKK